MIDSGNVEPEEMPCLVKAEFGRLLEGFRALSDWGLDLWDPSFAGNYSDFWASLRSLNMGAGVLVEWQSAAIQLYRSPAHVAHSNLDFYRIVINLAGDHHTTFGSKENIPLRKGDIGIFDETVSDHTTMGGAEAGGMVHCLVLMVPRARMAPLLRRPDSVHASVIEGGSSFGRFVSGHFQSIWRNGSLLTVAEADAAVQSLVTLAAGGVGRAADAEESMASETRRTLLATIKRHIESQLGAPELNGDAVCRQFGLSRATLARLFEAEGGLTHYVQLRRLHRAFVMLGSAAYRHWRIIDIALECNFSSDATFTRAFRKLFDLTPGDVRRMANGVRPGGSGAMAPAHSILPWLRQLDEQAPTPSA